MSCLRLSQTAVKRCSCTAMLLAVVSLSALALNLATRQAHADDATPVATSIATYERWVTALAFAPTSNTLVTVGGQSLHYRPGDVKLWDVSTGNLLASLEGHPSNVWSVAISPDGKTLITSGYDGKVMVWNVEEKKAVATLEKHKGWCRSVALTADGKHFATAGEDGNVIIWQTEGTQELKTIKAHESAVNQLTFSPDGSTLATAGSDKLVKLWSWQEAEPKEVAKLAGHDDAVWSVAFSTDGKIATAGADRTIRLWDMAGKELTSLRGHKDWVSSVAFSPDNKWLASASHDRTVKVWNLELAIKLADEVNQTAARLKENKEGAQKAVDEAAEAQTQGAAAKSKAAAIAAVLDARRFPDESKQLQELVAMDAYKNNSFLKKVAEEAKAAAEAATKSADEKSKALESDKEFSEKLKKYREGAVDEANAEMATLNTTSEETAAKVKAAEEKKVAAEKVVEEAQQKTRELAEQQSKTLADHKSSVWGVAFSPDGKFLASGSHKDSLRVWAVAEMKELFPHAAAETPAAEKKSE